MRALGWLLSVALLTFVAGCQAPPDPNSPASLEKDRSQIDYLIMNICIPHFEEGVPFMDIVKKENLTKITTCNIQDCLTSYCASGASSGCVPSVDRSCTISIFDSDRFSVLNNSILDDLKKDSQVWRKVKPRPIGAAYKTAYCNAGNTTLVETDGYVAGQVIGVLPSGPPIRARRTEFDIHVSAGGPQNCAPP